MAPDIDEESWTFGKLTEAVKNLRRHQEELREAYLDFVTARTFWKVVAILSGIFSAWLSLVTYLLVKGGPQ